MTKNKLASEAKRAERMFGVGRGGVITIVSFFAAKFLYSKYSKQEVVRSASPNRATIFKDGFHECTK